MKALLIIDVQYDFLPGGALAVPGGDAVIPLINELQNKFDLVVATQDWHPLSHKSFAGNHEGKKPFEMIELNGLPQKLWPHHCIQASAGASFSQHLKMERVEAIFRKGMDPEIDSYSGFFDNGHLKSTALAEYLKGKKVTDVYIAGLAGDYCVYFSAKDSLAAGFKTNIIEDTVRAIDPANFEKAKADIIGRGGKIVTSAAILT